MSIPLKVALIGNPNTGKTSLFNTLTGLKQKVGNYPGITVEKKTGTCKLSDSVTANIIDLPGTYSLNASSEDESIAVKVLSEKENAYYPDVVIVVAEVENLKRNLLLFTQVKDLGLPIVLAINMQDIMRAKGITIDVTALEQELNTKIVVLSAKKNTGIAQLKEAILNYKDISLVPCAIELNSILREANLNEKQKQHKDTVKRYQFIKSKLDRHYTIEITRAEGFRAKLDEVITHKVFGYIIFFTILFSIFQALFSWSEYPMELIDSTFAFLSDWTKNNLPEGVFTRLLSEGIIPGIGGVVIFIPQIAFLFLFLSILEESGYMSRVVFLMDKIMRKFGLSGKSVVPLISGTACAIPAIMAARNIENWKERLITILVTPFTTCAARLPVYAIIISLVIPKGNSFLGMSNHALVLMSLYMLGFGAAILSAYILNKVLKIHSKSYFVIEMPNYKMPLFKNVFYNVLDKTKAFVLGAGKIILAVSILLWVLASYGPGADFDNAEELIKTEFTNLEGEELDTKIASYKLEHSYIGTFGKFIEPSIKPLGYDWKIGIALITSFAAREVFIGTLATIYSVGSDDEATLMEKMKKEVHSDTMKPVFDFPTGISLLLFYAFAMQCMSTVAIVKKETNGWKWPMIQMFGMTIFAYLVALVSYQVFN
ncbi:MAG: ferrous iron transport protein B [Flavobacteriaceae bacterium]|nr:ferrous iron transport protein B [Flavobacteriaceae bacterium]